MLRRFPINPSTVMTIGLFLRFKSGIRLAHTKKSSFLDGHYLSKPRPENTKGGEFETRPRSLKIMEVL